MVNDDSWMRKILGGRSVIAWILGSFFRNPSNTSGVLAVLLVGTLIYLLLANGEVPVILQNFVALILGFYFGGALQKGTNDEE